MGYKTVGNTLAEWEDSIPLFFMLSEEVGSEDARRSVTIEVDLHDLTEGFSENFLLTLKDLLIEWRNKISLFTLGRYSQNLRVLLCTTINLRLFDTKIDVIDEPFLLAIETVAEQMTENRLKTLRSLFRSAPYSPLWAPSLHADFFPKFNHKKGAHGRQISRILSKALTRAACVHILSRCEQAYDAGEMDIGLFAFANLAFAVFCRPDSYRQIQLGDLIFDEKSNSYFLYITPAKTRVQHPAKICYRINEPLGVLLTKQRQNVINRYSHLVGAKNVSKLALFPSRRLNSDGSAWLHKYPNENYGMYHDSASFITAHPTKIRKIFLSAGLTINANALRHTVGTQLAQTGASSRTIQAVLKHAGDVVCRAYVDIAFHGLIDALSDAMQPAFDTHLPVFTRFRSKHDPVEVDHAIRSDDPMTGQIELTGECGKLIQCEYAPITCYGCTRFIPCWDADHRVNLATVEREIEDFKLRGRPFQHRLETAQAAKYHIILVMNAADRYQQGCISEYDHE